MYENNSQERRRAARLNFDIEAVVKCPEMSTALACTVRDISETGARLQSDSGDRFPDEFRLYLEHEGVAAECIVVWRSKSEVGVVFESSRMI